MSCGDFSDAADIASDIISSHTTHASRLSGSAGCNHQKLPSLMPLIIQESPQDSVSCGDNDFSKKQHATPIPSRTNSCYTEIAAYLTHTQ